MIESARVWIVLGDECSFANRQPRKRHHRLPSHFFWSLVQLILLVY